MMDLERELYAEMINIYKKSEIEMDYKPFRVLQMLNSGALPSEVIKRIIFIEGGSFDFEILKSKNRLDLSIEAIVLKKRYEDIFSDKEKAWCKLKLKKSGYDFKE